MHAATYFTVRRHRRGHFAGPIDGIIIGRKTGSTGFAGSDAMRPADRHHQTQHTYMYERGRTWYSG